jgi:hypothetical protein
MSRRRFEVNMKSKAIFFLLTMLVGVPAVACSIRGSDRFEPTLERWEQHPGPAQSDPNSEGDYWEKVPAPVVAVTNVIRGSTDPGSSCGDAGVLELEISLPETSTYNISEFAFYFRVVRGRLPDEIFPDIPLVGIVEGDKALLSLAWLDGHPRNQFPLDLEVDVFLVTNGLNIGPSTRFAVVAGFGAD